MKRKAAASVWHPVAALGSRTALRRQARAPAAEGKEGDTDRNRFRRQLAVAELCRYVRDQDAKRGPLKGGRAMPRMAISIAEMVERIRQIAASIPHCAKAYLVPTVGKVDEDGCNWELPPWAVDDRLPDCRALIAGDIESLRARFNIG